MEENLHSSETNKNNKNKKHDAKTVLQQCLEPLKCPEDGECFLPSLQRFLATYSKYHSLKPHLRSKVIPLE